MIVIIGLLMTNITNNYGFNWKLSHFHHISLIIQFLKYHSVGLHCNTFLKKNPSILVTRDPVAFSLNKFKSNFLQQENKTQIFYPYKSYHKSVVKFWFIIEIRIVQAKHIWKLICSRRTIYKKNFFLTTAAIILGVV